MRQKDHKPFAVMFNRLLEGKHTEQDKAFMQSKVIRADYRHDNSSSMKKRLLRTKKTTEDRPTPADADSVPLVMIGLYIALSSVKSVCSNY